MNPQEGVGLNTSEASPVLLVDDDEAFFLLARRALAKLGIPKEHVVHCMDGEEAIELLQRMSITPSFVILDQKMPRCTGIEVLSWMRSRKPLELLQVFLMSTAEFPDDVVKAYQLGAMGYFVKPLGMSELGSLLESIVRYWKSGVRGQDVPGSLKPNQPVRSPS